jgi:hypothetical protein
VIGDGEKQGQRSSEKKGRMDEEEEIARTIVVFF